MDSVSHYCFSYLVCRGTGTAPTAKVGLAAAGIALLPDLDFLLLPVLPELARFAFHRGPSHSLFIAVAMGLLLSPILSRWLGLRWPRAFLLCALAWTSHIFLDMCTGFGVALWWPFSHARVSFDLLFVVDPLATLPLLVACVWDACANWKLSVGRRRVALLGLLLWSVYAAISFSIRSTLEREFLAELDRRGHAVLDIHLEPTPFNNQLWYLCGKTDEGFVITYRSIWDGKRWERLTTLPQIQEPLADFAIPPLEKKMTVVLEDWFTCRFVNPDQLHVVDLRLGKRYGWEDDDAPFLFVYRLQNIGSSETRWSMEKPANRYNFGRLKSLFARMMGSIPNQRLEPMPMPEDSSFGTNRKPLLAETSETNR